MYSIRPTTKFQKDLKRIDIKDDLTYEYICEAEVVAKDIVDLEENNEEE